MGGQPQAPRVGTQRHSIHNSLAPTSLPVTALCTAPSLHAAPPLHARLWLTGARLADMTTGEQLEELYGIIGNAEGVDKGKKAKWMAKVAMDPSQYYDKIQRVVRHLPADALWFFLEELLTPGEALQSWIKTWPGGPCAPRLVNCWHVVCWAPLIPHGWRALLTVLYSHACGSPGPGARQGASQAGHSVGCPEARHGCTPSTTAHLGAALLLCVYTGGLGQGPSSQAGEEQVCVCVCVCVRVCVLWCWSVTYRRGHDPTCASCLLLATRPTIHHTPRS
jgi:hypothetical protein